MANKWFKFYGQDWLTDMKVGDLSAVDRLCYITLLALANDDGTISGFTEARTIRATRIGSSEEVEAIGFVKRLVGLKMLEVEGDAARIPRFAERQQRAMTGYERVKKYRESRRLGGDDNEDNANDNDDDNEEDNVEKRIEENRIEKKREKRATPAHAKLDYLKNIPAEDMKKFTERFGASEAVIKSKAEDLLLYCQRKRKTYANYYAFLLNALKRDLGDKTTAGGKYGAVKKTSTKSP